MAQNFLCILEFTPLEFETIFVRTIRITKIVLEFTPLEFETDLDNGKFTHEKY